MFDTQTGKTHNIKFSNLKICKTLIGICKNMTIRGLQNINYVNCRPSRFPLEDLKTILYKSVNITLFQGCVNIDTGANSWAIYIGRG